MRRGISLMEVLISMFVLTVGLLGVAALIPAGSSQITAASKLDNASMVGRAAFREMQIRGYLNPASWKRGPYTGASVVYEPDVNPQAPFTVKNNAGGNMPSDQVAYCIDPLGKLAGYDFSFPHGVVASTPPALMRIYPFSTLSNDPLIVPGVYDSIFRSSFDLVLEPNAKSDFPPSPRWFKAGGVDAKRMSEGNYSWLATITSDPWRPAVSGEVLVSVVVFYKRDLSDPGAGEYPASVVSYGSLPLTSGGSLVVGGLPVVNGRTKALKPGQWIMLAGVRTASDGTQLNYHRWYKVLSAANPDGTDQNITIAGQDWNCPLPAQVWIFDNVVSVYEKHLPLELN